MRDASDDTTGKDCVGMSDVCFHDGDECGLVKNNLLKKKLLNGFQQKNATIRVS